MEREKERRSEFLSRLGSIAGTVLGFIVIAGISLNSCGRNIETIPDNAKVRLNDELKYWVPDTAESQKHLAADRIGGDWRGATWDETKKLDYTLPDGWETYWKDYTSGRDVGSVQHWLFPSEGRWNEDGTWNY